MWPKLVAGQHVVKSTSLDVCYVRYLGSRDGSSVARRYCAVVSAGAMNRASSLWLKLGVAPFVSQAEVAASLTSFQERT